MARPSLSLESMEFFVGLVASFVGLIVGLAAARFVVRGLLGLVFGRH